MEICYQGVYVKCKLSFCLLICTISIWYLRPHERGCQTFPLHGATMLTVAWISLLKINQLLEKGFSCAEIICSHLIILAKLPLVTPSSSSGTGSWRVPRQTATYVYNASWIHIFYCFYVDSYRLYNPLRQWHDVILFSAKAEKLKVCWWPQN